MPARKQINILNEYLLMVLVERKIPNGKLVRVEVDFTDKIISHIKITGDFFVHPEDALLILEKNLVGSNIDGIKETVKMLFATLNAEIIGFSHDDLSSIILECYLISQGKGQLQK